MLSNIIIHVELCVWSAGNRESDMSFSSFFGLYQHQREMSSSLAL